MPGKLLADHDFLDRVRSSRLTRISQPLDRFFKLHHKNLILLLGVLKFRIHFGGQDALVRVRK